MSTHHFKRQKLEHYSSDINGEDLYTSSSEHSSSDIQTGPLPTVDGPYGSKHSAQKVSRPHQHTSTSFAYSSYHSNLFKLQLDELLETIRPEYETRFIDAKKAIHRLQGIIENIPDSEGLLASDAQRQLKSSGGVSIPFLKTTAEPQSKLLLAYSKPTNIYVVGSFARKTALVLDGKVTIDLAVTMPSHLFQAKDYRDYRYFLKRAYYLARLADGIQNVDTAPFAMSFEYQDDNPLQPVLIVDSYEDNQAERSTRSGYRIRILLAASNDLFPVNKTLPTQACVRHSAHGIQKESPSPTYNATLRSECSSCISSKQLQQSLAQSDGFHDACLLGAVWLRQRGFGSSMSRGGFGQFEWASVISMLMRGGGRANLPLLSSGYSSYQLFKATLQFLATNDLTAFPLVLRSTDFKLASTDYPVFFDGAWGLNILFKMSPWSYKLLCHEAKSSLKALNDPLVDHLKALFINRVDEPTKKYDYIFRMSLQQRNNVTAARGSALDGTFGLTNILYEKLSYGLGDRATLIYPFLPSGTSWHINTLPPFSHRPFHVTVGLLLNPETSRRTVDRGPSIDDKRASSLFREFWGEKAELRRFKDGTVLESVVWSERTSKQEILDEIIEYILYRHLDLNKSDGIDFPLKAFDRLLPQQTATFTGILGPFSSVRSAYEALCKSIRSLEGLPLHIRQASAASPQLRFSSVFAPDPGNPQSLRWPVEFHVQFEGSARWPQDLNAVQRTKIAFLLKIAEGLERDASVSAASLGLDNKKHKLAEEPFLDIATVDGIVFRLRIHHEHELKLLEQALHGQSPSPLAREELALAISDHKRRYIQSPAHTQSLYTLSTRFPLLSPTIRLLQEWRDAHLLSPHLRDEYLELLAIRTFVHPYPWQQPGSLESALIRTLAFIASRDWQSDPLIVDFSAELKQEDIEAIRVRFQAWRKLDPGMNRVAMFAASNLDREGITWTDRRPAKVIAARFTKLAAAASEIIKEKGLLDLDPEMLFVPSLGEYDFVIHLKHEHGLGKVKGSSFKNLQMASRCDPFDVILNPAQSFLDELEELHGDHIVLFYNGSATKVIAGLWNPQTGPRNWKANLDYSTMPTVSGDGSAEPRVTINKAAVLHDIARLGGDMIARIDRKP